MDFEKIIVTGGCGFIGSNCCDYFASKAEKIKIIDNYSGKGAKRNAEWLKSKHKNIDFFDIDISKDFKSLKKEISGADAIIHLAGQVAVTFSVKDPRTDFNDNALGTFNVLEAARIAAEDATFIFASTNKVYGGMETVEIIEKESRFEYKDFPKGIPETSLLDFHSPYGCSKGCADQYVRDYARIYGLNNTSFRQSCIYGERQFGMEDQGWVAWFIIASLLDKPLTIYGNGKQVRDILYIRDLIKSYELALKNPKKVKGKIFNVGGGHENTLSLLELISVLEKWQNKKIKHSFTDWRVGDQPVYISDISSIQKAIDWHPETGTEEGIRKLFDWVSNNINLFKDF